MSNQTGTGFGIAGLVVGILAVFVPVVGIYVSALALLLCSIGAFMGERAFTIAVVAITFVKTFFLSPSFAVLRAFEADTYEFPILTLAVVIAIFAPIAAMFIGSSKQKNKPVDTSM
ncbi:MAG: hypothetical protein JJU18_12440 [Oceanicaulis sp.]|nr:hypothetical protein [Oceanicaulis sp.]